MVCLSAGTRKLWPRLCPPVVVSLLLRVCVLPSTKMQASRSSSDARDAAPQTVRVVNKILSGEPPNAILSELYDHLCFWLVSPRQRRLPAKKFAGKVERTTLVRPERRAAEAALAEGRGEG